MTLPALDQRYLADRKIEHVIHVGQGEICVVLPGWQLPVGLNVSTVDVLLRLSVGYPDIAPDMWWTDPPVRRADGTVIPGTEVTEQVLGRSWQRWSRHFQPGQWQSGVDGLESFFALIRSEFELAAQGRAA